MESSSLKLRCCTTLHIHDLASLICNDKRAFKLAKALRVNPKVGLERMPYLYPRRHINKTPSTKNSTIKCTELIVSCWNYFAKPLPEDLRIPLEAFCATQKNHSLSAHSLLNVRIGGFAIKL